MAGVPERCGVRPTSSFPHLVIRVTRINEMEHPCNGRTRVINKEPLFTQQWHTGAFV